MILTLQHQQPSHQASLSRQQAHALGSPSSDKHPALNAMCHKHECMSLLRSTVSMRITAVHEASIRLFCMHTISELSCVAGVMCPGSENTCSKPPTAHPGSTSAAMGSASQQPIANVFFDSQQSGKNKRKASMVNELICQGRKSGKRTTSRGRLADMSQ